MRRQTHQKHKRNLMADIELGVVPWNLAQHTFKLCSLKDFMQAYQYPNLLELWKTVSSRLLTTKH